jgi:hypothetical protein
VIGIAMLLAIAAPGFANDQAKGAQAPVTISIEIGDRSDLERLSRQISIEDVRGTTVRAVVTRKQLEEIETAGWRWNVVPPRPKLEHTAMCADGWVEKTDREWTCYPSYQQYVALMQKYATDRSDLCRLVDLGATANLVRPHRLWAMIISDNPGDEEDEPEVLLTSTMHGDETSGFVLTLRLIDHLVRGYDDDSEIRALVDETEIWINPLANPDGAYFSGDDTVADAIRFFTTAGGSATEVDANRNFPGLVGGNHPDGNAWWPETEAMMVLAESNTFVLSANFHDGAEVVNYPWDAVPRRHPDDLWFQNLAGDWAALAQTDGPTGYMTGVSNDGTTNGYDWYEVHGGRQDFVTFFHGGRELTIEIYQSKLPPPAQLDDLWSWNRRAFLDFLGHAHQGIRGIVTDTKGNPLAATVEVLGIDRPEDGSTARTDPEVGDYHRLLLPGLYDLRIEAPDFRPREIFGVVVSEGEASRIDVSLHRAIRRPSGRSSPARGKVAPRFLEE